MNIIVMEAATWVLYLLGTAWLAYSAHMTLSAALAVGVIPFIVEDLLKMVLAAFVALQVHTALFKAHLVD
jgi:biotin transport system substrate-specific component